MSKSSVVLLVVVALFLRSHIANAENWSSFQNGGTLALDAQQLPMSWSPKQGIAWKQKLAGYGQSATVIQDQTVYVTSISGDKKENLHLEAFDLKQGKKLWQYDAKNSSPAENSNYISRAAPSPVCDQQGVIAMFEGGNLFAISSEGELRWQRDLVADYGEIKARHGIGASLEQDEKNIYVWIERSEEPYLLAINKKNGKTKWKVAGLGSTSWSSPRLVPVEEGTQLVCSASGKISGFDPKTGKSLWTFEEIANNTICTPVPLGDGKFLIGASEGRGESTTGNPAESNGVLQIQKQKDGSYQAEFAWQAKKATSSFGSPMAAGGKAFYVNRTGVLFQLDLKTGEQLSTSRIASGSIWATPIATESHVYLFGKDGTTSIISLNDGEEIGSNELWELEAEAGDQEQPSFGGRVLYSASVSTSHLIIRSGTELHAIEIQ